MEHQNNNQCTLRTVADTYGESNVATLKKALFDSYKMFRIKFNMNAIKSPQPNIISSNEKLKQAGTSVQVEEEEKREILVVQHTFHPETSMKKGSREEDNGHHLDVIDDNEDDTAK